MDSWALFFAIIPGIILFLYGIEQFSREVQVAAGEYLRGIIQRLTKTPVRGTAAGAVVTAIVQSSTATTVITVGLVNAGIISFTASLGIIFGANLGTTMTSQLVAFNLTAFAPLFILAGFLIGIIPGKYRIFGRPVFYFGLVFFSLSLISGVMAPYRTDPQLLELMGMMDTVFLQIAFGFLITNIFQSSSVTTGLVVVMSQNGLITPGAAIPVLLGANLGTPTTSLLVATRMNTSAKRAAVAHFLFNFLGVLIFLPFLAPFTALILGLGGDAGRQVANAHLLFNLVCCIIFLVLLGPFTRLVMRVVPGREDDVVFMPAHIRHPLPAATPEAIAMLEREIWNMLTIPGRLLAEMEGMVADPKKYSPQVRQLRDYATYLDGQISEAALGLSGRDLSPAETERIAGLVRISKLGQVLADQTGELVEILHAVQEKGIALSAASRAALEDTLIPCSMNLKTLEGAFPLISDDINESMRKQDDRLRRTITSQYREYLRRFAAGRTPSGSEFSRILFQIEGMAGTIREIRKSTRLLDRS
ncbi:MULTISPECIES: Na/Pi cotransporter family protein [unclassified Methanoregula]|uniref:Na/Pi cotransporter family protein n=1 Tax=unclassified Methanoregula TaxID=2649730 RepID=UPI0009D14778|nr:MULTISPECIES: Na/Pi cotransporter family protein [unclassified Methanoregula]OPX64889.1 MAG: Na+/Pi-cotransporter [Methanoregula sp. PtaB.Bin085]OPY32941.1 MAG: Na+/Pi-cotransporter [Methanoregula sp. PtaU1.Bin006]